MKAFSSLTIFFCIAICGGATAAAAQPSEAQAIDDAIACRNIEDAMERLACLDAAAETLSVTRIIREEEVAAHAENEKKQFGLSGGDDILRGDDTPEEFGSERIPEKRKERENKRLKSILSKVVEIRISKFGKVTLTLENGQVWRQLNSDSKVLRINGKDKLYTAKVKRSIMGNYMLTIKELKRTIRVRRIK